MALKVLLLNEGFAIFDFFAAKFYWLKLELRNNHVNRESIIHSFIGVVVLKSALI